MLTPVWATHNAIIVRNRYRTPIQTYATACGSCHIGECMVSRHHGRDSEVRQLHSSIFVGKNVGTLDVSVDHSLRVQVD